MDALIRISLVSFLASCASSGGTVVERFPPPATGTPAVGRVTIDFRPPLRGCAVEVAGYRVPGSTQPIGRLVVYQVPLGPARVVVCPEAPAPFGRTVNITTNAIATWELDQAPVPAGAVETPASVPSGLAVHVGYGFRSGGWGGDAAWDQRVADWTFSAWAGLGSLPRPGAIEGRVVGVAAGVAAETGARHRLGVDLGYGSLDIRLREKDDVNVLLPRESAWGPAATLYYRFVDDGGLSLLAGFGMGYSRGEAIPALNFQLGYTFGGG